MSVHILAPDGAGQHPGITHITSERGASQRSRVLRYRLRYAEWGVSTSPADVVWKKSELKGWQEEEALESGGKG